MLIGGLDIGTTGCKITVYDHTGLFVESTYCEYNVSREGGEHEVDANVISEGVFNVIKNLKCKNELEALGVTSFGETFVILDENDNVLCPSMLYTDPRGVEECKLLSDKMGEENIISISGVKPHQMYSLPKVMWIRNNKPEIYAKAKRVLLIEDYIVYVLSGIAQIDYSLAARTMAFDIKNKCWSDKILSAAGVDKALFSNVVPTGTLAGNVRSELCEKLGVSRNLKIVSGCHDQIASAVGAGVLEPGCAVDGTGTVECVTPVFDHIPENKTLYEEGYSVVPYVFDGTYVCYALSFTGGATLKWFRDNLAKYEHEISKKDGKNVFAYLDSLVSDKPTDILILPHFAGAANPYMDSFSRAAIVNLSLEHTSTDIYKALMEGVTYEIMTNIEHLESFGIKLDSLYATGGGATSPVWLQIKADILSRPVSAIDAKEVGALGTCMMVCVALGVYKDLHEAKNVFVKTGKTYAPNSENSKVYNKNYAAYKKLYSAVRPIVKEINNA